METKRAARNETIPNHVCVKCGRGFHRWPSALRKSLGVYCSQECRYPGTHADRFWARVDKNGPIPAHRPELGPCWIWIGRLDKRGYGRVWMVGENSLAHRLAWKFTYGELPDDLWVLHQCDNPLCQRPDHLFLGKSLDNIQDKVAKGRQARGESQGLSKLTEADVREIRRLHAAGGLFRRPLAERFGVSEVQIGLIVRRLAWRHVD